MTASRKTPAKPSVGVAVPATKSKAEVAREIQAYLRDVSQRAAGLNRLEYIANRIENAVPKDSDNSDAQLVHRYIGLARAALAKGKTFEAAIEAGAWLHDATAYWKDCMLWKDALRGERFSANKRGLSRLYREAVAILERRGAKYPAKLVLRELETIGVIRYNEYIVRWKDDKGRNKKTPVPEFGKNLSKKRNLFH